MAYKTGQRNQLSMMPKTVEDYVVENDPVRAYDAFIEALNFSKLGIIESENRPGNTAYDPKAMMKLLIYGYSYGIRSSRKLERATYHNISFIWLMGGLKPDHKTIANFRRTNREALKKCLKQCAKLCIELNLIEGNTLFLDGTKIRANASINQTKTKEKLKKELIDIDSRIEEILKECDQSDAVESGSLVEMNDEFKDKKKLQNKISTLIKTMEIENKDKINCTDTECTNMKGRQGSHAGYNAQTVADEKYGLIVSTEVVNKNNDLEQFSAQIEGANKVLGKDCTIACADAGYANTTNLKKILDKGITVVVPSQKQALHKPVKDNPFSKDKFKYDKKKDCYICPENKELSFSYYKEDKNHNIYRIRKKGVCTVCKHYGKCTKNKIGRSINRLKEEETKELLELMYATDAGQEIYKKRKEKVELPFGHIKRNLTGGAFLLRGLDGVNAEMAINATCFNIARMLTILGGVCPFIQKIAK
jgi:transposase